MPTEWTPIESAQDEAWATPANILRTDTSACSNRHQNWTNMSSI